MRTVIQREHTPVPTIIDVPYCFTKPEIDEPVSIVNAVDFAVVAMGIVSSVTTVTDGRWKYQITVTERAL